MPAEFGPWIRGFLRISHSAEASWTVFIFEINVQLWRSQHFWFWSFRKSSTNRASDYLSWCMLNPIVDFMIPHPEDIITNVSSQITKQHTHYETAKIFLHLSQLPGLHFVLRFNEVYKYSLLTFLVGERIWGQTPQCQAWAIRVKSEECSWANMWKFLGHNVPLTGSSRIPCWDRSYLPKSFSSPKLITEQSHIWEYSEHLLSPDS